MNEEVVTIPTRDDFIKFINERLVGLGFVKNGEYWKLEKDIQLPGQTIIINGQRHDQPGATQHVIFGVDVYGDGEMKDINTDTSEHFVQVEFWNEQDGTRNDIGPTFCMSFDDHLLFNELLNKFFGI